MLCTGKEACCTWYNVQCYVQERLPAVPGNLYSVYIYRKGCLLYLVLNTVSIFTGKVAWCTGILYSVYMYRKGCLLYLVLNTMSIFTGKVSCCTWYYIQSIYVQERFPAVPGILYSVYMYRKGCLLYLGFCTLLCTGKVACCT